MIYYKLLSKYKKVFFSLGLITLILVILNSALLKDVVYESDDYFLHATRIGNYYVALKEFQFPVRWGPNLNESYGYPAFNYMYHTPYLAATLFHILGLSVQQSLNISVLLASILGSIGIYFLIKQYLNSEKWAVILGIFYTLNPYMLLNIYWRGAVGEIFFLGFVPYFLIGLKKKNFLLITISTALLILSHLPSMLLLGGISIVYYLTQFKKEKFKDLLPIFKGGVAGMLISSWYWVPAYFEQWMITYNAGESLIQYKTQFINILSILNINRDFLSNDLFTGVITIGGVALLGIFIGLLQLKKNKQVKYWLLLIFISLFLITPQSVLLWDNLKPLQYVQYPWRFIWPVLIAVIFIFTEFIKTKSISSKNKNFIFVLTILGILFSSEAFISNKGFTSRTDFDWYHPVHATGSSFNEHNPIWANKPYNFQEPLMYLNATESSKLNSNNVNEIVHPLNKLNPIITKMNGTTISYTVSPQQDIIVLHKRLFYPGWEALLDEKEVDFIQNIPQYNGILAINVPAKESNIYIRFTGYTLLRRISEMVSLITFIGLTIYLLKKVSQKS